MHKNLNWFGRVEANYHLQSEYSEIRKLIDIIAAEDKRIEESFRNSNLSPDEKRLEMLKAKRSFDERTNSMNKLNEVLSVRDDAIMGLEDSLTHEERKVGTGIGGFFGKLFSGRLTQKSRNKDDARILKLSDLSFGYNNNQRTISR